jgi:hypothetical protein
MQQYVIVGPPGAGCLFVSSVFCAMVDLLDIDDVVISDKADCHDSGMGVWQGSSNMQYYDERFHQADDIKVASVIMTHSNNIAHVRESFKEHAIVGLFADPTQYKLIATLKTMKQHTLTWNKEIYASIKGDGWPPYSKNNIMDSKMIRGELIEYHNINETAAWYDTLGSQQLDFVINVQSVFGIDDDLVGDVERICGKKVCQSVHTFISRYQRINKEIYGIT